VADLADKVLPVQPVRYISFRQLDDIIVDSSSRGHPFQDTHSICCFHYERYVKIMMYIYSFAVGGYGRMDGRIYI